MGCLGAEASSEDRDCFQNHSASQACFLSCTRSPSCSTLFFPFFCSFIFLLNTKMQKHPSLCRRICLILTRSKAEHLQVGCLGEWDTYAWKVDSGPRRITFVHLTDIYDMLILSQAR